MPGTRARRAREYRAGASSLELIGERPTPANSVDRARRTVRLKASRKTFLFADCGQLYRRMLKRPSARPQPPRHTGGVPSGAR